MKAKVVFRADGNGEIGLGHVIRSLALVEMLKDEFECWFAIQEPSDALCKQIESACSRIVILPIRETNDEHLMYELDSYLSGDEIVVLDGYKFITNYQKRIKKKGCGLVCIDDIHAYHFIADIVINHGLLKESLYSCEPHTKMLLGPKYCLLREPFINNRFISKDKASNSVFVCFGGADMLNLTAVYLQKIIKHAAVTTVHVVLGSAFIHMTSLEEIMSAKTSCDVYIYKNLPSKELATIIRSCKVAIVPGSTISLECASLGINIICGYYVNNQADIVSMLSELGMAISIGEFTEDKMILFNEALSNLLIEDLNSPMVLRQRDFFDGLSKGRLLEEFKLLREKTLC